jgi:glycosyltransferase involved in cell wall biosynthesis
MKLERAAKISVAMCTYNGGAYLNEQLESIQAQSRLPDELVICDDNSSDTTSELLQTFVARAAFPVHVHLNARNLGSTKNFEKALGLCNGDIIALSDQDDVWQAEKLERIEKTFLAAPQASLVFTNAEIVDERLRPLGRQLFSSVGLTPRQQNKVRQGRAFEVLLAQNFVTGATLAFHSHWRRLILPIPTEFPLIHDAWLALVIAAVADLVFIDEPLIQYRQHPRQQMGARQQGVLESVTMTQKTSSSAYLNDAEQFGRVYNRLLANRELCRERMLSLLAAKIDHLHARARMPAHRLRRIPVVLGEMLGRRYARYSRGLYSAAKDMLF